jgi:hypothetical protein
MCAYITPGLSHRVKLHDFGHPKCLFLMLDMHGTYICTEGVNVNSAILSHSGSESGSCSIFRHIFVYVHAHDAHVLCVHTRIHAFTYILFYCKYTCTRRMPFCVRVSVYICRHTYMYTNIHGITLHYILKHKPCAYA